MWKRASHEEAVTVAADGACKTAFASTPAATFGLHFNALTAGIWP